MRIALCWCGAQGEHVIERVGARARVYLEIDEPVEHLGRVRAAVTIVPQKHYGCSVQLMSAQVGFEGLP